MTGTGGGGLHLACDNETLRLTLEQATQVCFHCTHFPQHYPPRGNAVLALHCGHCCYPRMKDRQVTDTCQHFQNKYQKEESE